MPADRHYTDSVSVSNLENLEAAWLDWSRLIEADDDTQGELLYYTLACLRKIKPVFVLRLMQCAANAKQAATLLRLLDLAATKPEIAEGLAGDAVDTFHPHHAEKADCAYQTILAAAGERLSGPGEWQHIADVIWRVEGAIDG